MHTIHAPPVRLHATLLPPLRLHIRAACGARGVSGSTLVEVTLEHPTDVHQVVVLVTGISFHPGQSRLREDNDATHSDMYDVEVLEEEEDGVESNSDGGRGIGNVSNATTNPFPTNTIAKGKSVQGGELSIIDISRRVRWGYASGSAPELPYTLGPYKAFVIVMQIDSSEDVRRRAFVSPISVNATIGRHN